MSNFLNEKELAELGLKAYGKDVLSRAVRNPALLKMIDS